MEGGRGWRRDKAAGGRRAAGISEARDSLGIIKRQQQSCNTQAVKDGEGSIVEHTVRARGGRAADNLVLSERLCQKQDWRR